MESPRPGPTSPRRIWRPRCIMKPVIEPAEPSTMIVPPFWSIPVRAPTRPLTTRSPPRSAAPEVAEAAVEGDAAAREDADAERVLRPGVQDGDVLQALLIQEPAQLEVDLTGRQVLGVEHRPVAVDL